MTNSEMVEQHVTGGRSDLRLQPSRCSRVRYGRSSCSKCVDACPRQAITIAAGPMIDEDACSGCLLCTVACPVGAIERSCVLPTSLSRLTEAQDPILGCPNSGKEVDALLPCLGGISEEFLCVYSNLAHGRLAIDLSSCSSCGNGFVEARVRCSCDFIKEAGIVPEDRAPLLLGHGIYANRKEIGYDRRDFFKAFRKSMLSGAKALAASLDERGVTEMRYGDKGLPVRRVMLNAFRKEANTGIAGRITARFDAEAIFREACSGCFACAAACPTGALVRTPRRDAAPSTIVVPGFDPSACVSCGLCVEFCPEKALEIRPSAAANEKREAAIHA